jgi:hypothetical protein
LYVTFNNTHQTANTFSINLHCKSQFEEALQTPTTTH